MTQTLKNLKGGLCCKYDYGNYCGKKTSKNLKKNPFFSDYFTYGYFKKIKVVIINHTLKHTEDIGIKCYDKKKVVDFLKKYFVKGTIYTSNDRHSQKSPLGEFGTFIDNIKSKKCDEINYKKYTSVFKNSKNTHSQIHVGFNTMCNKKNEIYIKIFTVTNNVKKTRKNTRNGKDHGDVFLTKYSHNKDDMKNVRKTRKSSQTNKIRNK